MGKHARLPELDDEPQSPLAEAFAAVGGTLARNPVLVGGTTAFIVALSYVSANAIWYQPHFHSGAFFATRQAFISPESFTFIESAIILAIVVLVGMGSQLGVAIAAAVMIGGFELFRDLQEWRMLVFGAAMVLIMVLRPRGLIGTRTPSVALGEKRAIGAGLVGEGRG